MGVLRQRPMREAIIEESWTSGPSRPMEAPEAMENIAERDFTRLERKEMTPSPSTMASM